MKQSILVREERPDDEAAVAEVHRQAFAHDDEASLVAALRREGYARVSLVAFVDGQIVGHVMFSAMIVRSGDETLEALALAPLAVLPAQQGRGIGSALVRAGLDACRERGHRLVTVLGDPGYYRRFGFTPEAARPLESPYSGEHWMAVALVPGGLDGVAGTAEHAPPFSRL